MSSRYFICLLGWDLYDLRDLHMVAEGGLYNLRELDHIYLMESVRYRSCTQVCLGRICMICLSTHVRHIGLYDLHDLHLFREVRSV